MRSLALAILCVMALAAMCVSAATADVVFSNFGTGDSCYADAYFTIQNDQWLAAPFTVTGGDFSLWGVDLALFYDVAVGPALTVSIYSDSSGMPGSAIESMYLSGDSTAGVHVASVSSTSNPTLYDGTSYWVVASPTGDAENAHWCLNDTGDYGSAFTIYSTWYTQPTMYACAFRVNGDAAPVPEPSSILTLIAGLGTMGGMLFRRRK